ncbi:MAG: patatin-like phospholipase family protein, partial [Daejeonella sp.]
PYRCIVADIFSQKMIPLSHGSLAEAVRGTLTVPLIYRPIKIDGKYVFDGGIYNNFPVDVMQKEFNPDYIIGTNVSEKVFNEYPKDNDEKLINRFLLYMLLSKADSTSIGENGIYIHPDIAGFSATNFTPVEALIKRGYDATIADMPAIKLAVQRRISREEVKKKREKFNKRNPDLTFNNMVITGIKPKQKKYIESVFNNKNKSITLEDIKNGYYKLVADDNFETVYPRTSYDPKKDGYNFELRVQPQKNFKAELGGVISSRPISNAYLGLQYNYLHRNSYTFSANFYSGGFYESAQGAIRMDVPTNLPFYLETEFTYNHWNYFSNTQIFIENANPTYIDQSDRKIALKMGIPVAKNGKLEVQTGYMYFNHEYSPKNSYQLNDMLDENSYNGVFASINLERNTLNRRQYATRGRSFQLGLNMYDGVEHYTPGNIFRNEPFYDQIKETRDTRSWYKIKVSNEQYLINKRSYSFGYLFESAISNQPVFSTYKATLLSVPAFYPLQDSRSIFLEKMRANTYGAFGVKNIFKLYRNIDLRLEGYVFQPLEEFKLENWQSTSFEQVFTKRHYAATAGLVYNSIAGPVSLSFNHYDDKKHQFGVLFHVGFLIYNKRSFE